MAGGSSGLLQALNDAFSGLGGADPIRTADFACACRAIIPLLDQLGDWLLYCNGSLVPW